MPERDFHSELWETLERGFDTELRAEDRRTAGTIAEIRREAARLGRIIAALEDLNGRTTA